MGIHAPESPTLEQLIEAGERELLRRQRLSEALSGKPRKPLTEEHRRNVGEAVRQSHARRIKERMAREAAADES